MNTSVKSIAATVTASAALVFSANASQPPDVVASDANNNTAMGTDALLALTVGYENTAAGSAALISNTFGHDNTAFGAYALQVNVSGDFNTAIGLAALQENTTGFFNTGTGAIALGGVTTGSNNTANGTFALSINSTGSFNTATGSAALYGNVAGNNNTAFGYYALNANQASDNSGMGTNSLTRNTTGAFNTAFGTNALASNTTGSSNIAVGLNAGLDILGSNNIDIGNRGVFGDYNVIRIGTAPSHTATYIAGIASARVTGSAVYVTSTGQLGVLASSEVYKTDIASMGDTDKLEQLRPVTFHLKTEPNGALQYGLIAEEVDKVYPELVIRDQAGKIQGVRYEELVPMLLNEAKQQRSQMQQQSVRLQDVLRQLTELKQLNLSMQAALSKLTADADLVAMR